MAEHLNPKEADLFIRIMEERHESGVVLFGRYLALKGLITDEDIFNARMFQKGQNRRLGEIAVERGLLSEEDVERLLVYQEESGIRLGELAVYLGFMSREQVDMLLEFSEESYIYFGEALVSLGIINESAMLENLRTFQRFKVDQGEYNA
jgi:hypothetical protein